MARVRIFFFVYSALYRYYSKFRPMRLTLGTGEFAQRIIILPSLERAKKVEFNSTSCVTLAYSIPEIHILKVTTFLVQRLMRNPNKNCDGCVITRRNPEILISNIAHK